MSQQLPLSQQLRALEQLQELDLKIDQLKKNKSVLPVTLKNLEATLQKSRTIADAKKEAWDELEKTQRQTRAALDLARDRMARSNGRLEAVRNSQEYQAVSKEIDQLKKMSASLEEQVKKGDHESDLIRKEQEKLSAEAEKIQSERDVQAALLSSEGGKLEDEIGNLVSQRQQFTSQVDSRTLAMYERVRPARNGIGIAPASGGRCQGCHMVVPPQLYNEVCKGVAVHSCPSCHRILFVPAAQAST